MLIYNGEVNQLETCIFQKMKKAGKHGTSDSTSSEGNDYF